jgi:hypothetical protein
MLLQYSLDRCVTVGYTYSMRKHKIISERKDLENKLDTITSLIVRLRDGECITPGKSCGGHLTCSHYYPRTRKAIRWSLVNCHCQCQNCNGRHNHNPSFYAEWMLRHYSKKELLDLAVKANLLVYKWTVPELIDLLAEYQKLYLDLLASKATAPPPPLEIVQTGWI